jgi:predicted nucleic acid-binding protein
MNDKFFLDTNILIYIFDDSAPLKQQCAKNLIETALREGRGCISYQVIQECLNFLVQKAQKKASIADANLFLTTVLEPLCQLSLPNLSIYREALHIKEKWKYGFYDSIIIASALRLNCKILYSEDMHHQQRIDHLTIRNPFNE